METLQNKIDFAVVIAVQHANPNGDPLNGNRPRETYDGYGEISDVCLKRKIRNRMMDMGKSVFVQSDDKKNDTYNSLEQRAKSNTEIKK
ncbi:MAG: type I CRISPR-associated protein Cas7 [Dialister sp.]